MISTLIFREVDMNFKETIKNMRKVNRFDWVLFLAMVIMFSRVFYRLAAIGWKTADYTHAYFILPISLWFIFKKRNALVKAEGVSKSGATLFILGVASYLFAALNEFMFLEGFSFVLMMWAVFRLRFTKESFQKILFPLAYLLFLVPPPSLAIDTVTLPLKKISTYGSYFLFKLFRFSVEVHGAILKVGEHELFIADACSGFRSMVTLLALGAVYAYVQNTSLLKKWIIFLSVIPLGIMGNILRITITGCLSYFCDPKYAEGFFHNFSGMVLFVFTTIGLMILTELICKKQPPNTPKDIEKRVKTTNK